MPYYWVTFYSGPAGSVEAKDKGEAEVIGSRERGGVQVHKVEVIPYPATPVLHNPSGCPAFCTTPVMCSGRTCCPKRYACSE